MKKIICIALLAATISCKKNVEKDANLNFQKETNVNLASGPSSTTTCFNTYSITDNVQIEKDKIFSLLSLGVVYKNWQTPNIKPVRGYNIGSILVAPSGQIIEWARNCVDTTGNSTQHGEVRLMTSFLNTTEFFSLADEDNSPYVLYTSLEPCAMCSGMMTLQSLNRTVYSQTDPDYGKAVQRLEFDASKCGGCPPYPRAVTSDASPSPYRELLDSSYVNYLNNGGVRSITNYLTTPEAQQIYSNAVNDLMNYVVTYPENQTSLQNAIDFYNNVIPDKYVPLADNNDVLTSVFRIKGNGVEIGKTDMYQTYGANLYIVSSNKVFNTLSDIDGDAFFSIVNSNNPAEFAVIDSGGNINAGGPYISVMSQNGVSCAIKQTKKENGVYYFTIEATLTHANDCKWNGSACVSN